MREDPARSGSSRGVSVRLLRQPSFMVAVVVLALEITAAIGAERIAAGGYDAQDLSLILRPPFWAPGASAGHALGTDELGRDLLTRLVFGARVSLSVAAAGVLIGGTFGVLFGLVAGYKAGLFDAMIMRLADIQLAFPSLLLAVAIIAATGPNLVSLVLVLALRSWVVHARVVRGSALQLRESEFVLAAKALGARSGRIMLRHILPNALTPVVVVASSEFAQLILLEATLSFLGLGVQPPTPSWGSILSTAQSYLTTGWWLSALPGLVIMVTVLNVNVLGDGLRNAIDPRLRL